MWNETSCVAKRKEIIKKERKERDRKRQTMKKLLYGISQSFCSEPSHASRFDVKEDVKSLFRDRCKQFKHRDVDKMESVFLRLHSYYYEVGEETTSEREKEGDDRCLTYEKGTMTFSPLSVVKSGSPFSHQRYAFFTMMEAWKHDEDIETLILDFRGWNHSLIVQTMKHVRLSDMIDGIWIWRVLPMKIKSIVILEPNPQFFAYVAARSSSFFLLPKKVRSKIVFRKEG